MSSVTESTTQKRAHKDENGDDVEVLSKSQKVDKEVIFF